MKCKNCGSELKENSKFCAYCGSNTSVHQKYCTNCGNSLVEGADYCVKCGTKCSFNKVNNVEDDGQAYIYLIVAGICFVIPWFSYYIPYIGSLGFLSTIGVIVSLSLGMNRYPKKTYFKVLLINYVSLTLITLIFLLLMFMTCVSACS